MGDGLWFALLVSEPSISCQPQAFLVEYVTSPSQSASAVPWPVALNSRLLFKGIMLRHTIWSAGPASRDLESQCRGANYVQCMFRVAYASQINKNKLFKYFLLFFLFIRFKSIGGTKSQNSEKMIGEAIESILHN